MNELDELMKKYKRVTMLALVVAIVTVIDYFLPDPVILIDEAVLSVITGYLAWKQRILDKKIKNILKQQGD